MKRKSYTIKYVLSGMLAIVIVVVGILQNYPLANSKEDNLPVNDSGQSSSLAGTDNAEQGESNIEQEEESKEEPDSSEDLNPARKETDYLTFSNKGNVDIGIIFMNPITGDNENLVFMVMLNTHSVDLSQYDKLTDFIELQTDTGMIAGKNFEWAESSTESHHVNGILKIKNSFEGTPIFTDDTKYLKLIFKDIGAEGEREHLYQGEKLR